MSTCLVSRTALVSKAIWYRKLFWYSDLYGIAICLVSRTILVLRTVLVSRTLRWFHELFGIANFVVVSRLFDLQYLGVARSALTCDTDFVAFFTFIWTSNLFSREEKKWYRNISCFLKKFCSKIISKLIFKEGRRTKVSMDVPVADEVFGFFHQILIVSVNYIKIEFYVKSSIIIPKASFMWNR